MKEDRETITKLPLKTILTNFLNHIENLEKEKTPDNTYESEFQELKLFSESIKGIKQYSCSEGEKEVNRKKNRYKDILPFDVSRVVLNEYAGVPGSDYINANFIKGASGSPAYIASQGPLPHTVNDFWRMVVQCEVQVIVMACNEEEAGKHKCENYWVEGEGEEKQFGMVSLRLIKASTVCPDFSVRTMRLKYTNTQSTTEERTVCQFHYSAWPDHGVPPLVRPLLDMVRLVRDTQASETLPVLIHCSAGCGRTGTICAIDYVWGLLRAGKLTKNFSLLSLVREMRKQRIAMVQTKEQYVLVHRAVRELFKEQLRMIDSHPYENIDCNGLPLIKCPSPEATYDSISSFQNNIAEEKQDEKEKKQAPPLPKKKRFQTFSSKQAKEVENLSERQRLVKQAGSSSESVASTGSIGPRPRIATLRSLFEQQHAERDYRQVARSHSLGSVRSNIVQLQTNPVKERQQPVQKPIPGRGVLQVPQVQTKPALPVKRSKSLRVLGSSDRYKLSIPPLPLDEPSCEVDVPRRLSLESNYDEIKDLVLGETTHQPLSDYLSVDSIVAGLGVRERRNSFRQAVHRESQESFAPWPKKPGLLRSYTSVDMRSSCEKTNLTRDTPPAKPLLRPKPNLQSKPDVRTYDSKKVSSDHRQQFQSWPHAHTNQQFPSLNELKKSQMQASSSQTSKTYSMSLRLAPKPRREDCRTIMSHPMLRAETLQQSELVYSSGESTKSASSDPSFSSSKAFTPNTSRPTAKSQPLSKKCEVTSLEKKNIETAQRLGHQDIFSPRCTDNLNPGYPKDKINLNPVYPQDKISDSDRGGKYQGRIARQHGVVSQNPQGMPDHVPQGIHQRMKSSDNLRKNQSQIIRPVIYDSKGLKQSPTGTSTTTPKAPPPPYVEPGKNAQKPRSSPHSASDNQGKIGFYDEIHEKTRKQHHWQMSSSSRNMILSSHSSSNNPNLRGTNVKLNMSDSSESKSLRNVAERKQIEQDCRLIALDLYPKTLGERTHDHLDYRPSTQELQSVHVSEQRYREPEPHLRNDKKSFEQENHRSPHESESKNPVERRHTEQTFQSNPQACYSKSFIESFNKVGERRQSDWKFRSSPKEAVPSTGEKGVSDQDQSSLVHEQYPGSTERRPAPTYQSHELYSKTSGDRRPAEQNLQCSNQDPRAGYISRVTRSHNPGTPRSPANEQPSGSKPGMESETPVTHGVKMRRGSRDDLALCASTPSRVKRHASVVMLRHSLIEGASSSSLDPGSGNTPLSVWNQTNVGVEHTAHQITPSTEDPWSGAVGVDLDQVAASITLQKDGNMMRSALEALHLRKASQATPKSSSSSHKGTQKAAKQTQSTPKSSQLTPKPYQPTSKKFQTTAAHHLESGKVPGSPSQFQPTPETTLPGPFRKQQQYL